MADVPSRLSDGMIYYKGGYIPIAEYRQMITARSLYNLNNEYKNTQLFSSNGKNNLAESISTVLTVIPQYNRMQVNTNLAGNIYDAFRDEGSPLAKIGLIMLGKQMAYNSAMNLSVKYLPSVDVSQALKGNMKGVFKLNEDNTITVKDKESRTFLDKVGDFGSNFLGIDTYNVFGENPFPKAGVSNIEYIKNTGEAQLTHFYHAINMNLYKPVNYDADSNIAKTFVEYGEKVGVTIDSTRGSILANQPSFTFGNAKFRPYSNVAFDDTAVGLANAAMDISYSGNTDRVQEYAPTKDYVISNFGSTTKADPIRGFDSGVEPISNFTQDTSDTKLVWGRDGVGEEAKAYLELQRGTADKAVVGDSNNPVDDFKIREGLLEYTRNLLNASSGQFVDITRKTFVRAANNGGKTLVGLQGSALWQAPSAEESKYASDSGTASKTGIRQHTILDQYGNDTTEYSGIPQGFAKSIRFKGNIVYNGENNGSQNSVIYKSVLPRIHPTKNDKGEINNKNLMFSLENLAVGTVAREKYGVIYDEYGTPIPLSEVGPFAGRQMWFPPYNIEINEVAIAKYESTVMVGRNEPMYNYMNSERTAVLSFSLIVDYPEQLRNIEYLGEDKNKVIADFFAFGGNPVPAESQIERIEDKIDELKAQLEEIGGPTDQAEVPAPTAPEVAIYFQNDKPNTAEVNSIIDIMYNNPNHYEIINGMESAQDGNGFGLNKKIYFIENITGSSINNNLGVSGTSYQYTATGVTNQDDTVSQLNKNLLDVYGNPDTRKYYNIKIAGTASKLYLNDNEAAYNKALGNRRVAAAKNLIVSRLTAMFGATVANEIAESNFETVLDEGSSAGSTAGAEAENMHLEDVKKERSAIITFKRNSIPVDKKEQDLNSTQLQEKALIQADIQVLELQLSVAKSTLKENVFKDRNKAVLNSFESISGNQFYPVFHSQTPEDFHRRLTFLQQCTRQGAAKRYDIVDENTGELRARNSVFGKQPICIMRVGDFLHTKVVIESVTIDYADAPWDMNPEGFGMQPMMANITLQMKIIGGQSLQGPIDALQNAVTFNYYANSTFTDKGVYQRASAEASKQAQYIAGVVGEKQDALNEAYDARPVLKGFREGEL